MNRTVIKKPATNDSEMPEAKTSETDQIPPLVECVRSIKAPHRLFLLLESDDLVSVGGKMVGKFGDERFTSEIEEVSLESLSELQIKAFNDEISEMRQQAESRKHLALDSLSAGTAYGRMLTAQHMHGNGHRISDIAIALGKSESRIREYLKGVNWNSSTGTHTSIRSR